MSTRMFVFRFNSLNNHLEITGNEIIDHRNDHRILIVYFFLGVFNVFLYEFVIAFHTRAHYHITIFGFGILLVIIKSAPMFVEEFRKCWFIIWLCMNAVGTILLTISIFEDFYGYLTGLSSIIFVISTGIGEVLFLSNSINFQK